MKRFKKFGAVIFLSAYLFMGLGLTIPTQSLAASFTPQVGIPGSKDFQDGAVTSIGTEGVNAAGVKVMRSDLLARYIAAFYDWGFSIVGVIAVLIFMAAGVIWLTSGGDSGKISNAKKMIEGSLMGSALLLGSWFLLNTINPNLTKLPSIETEVIGRIANGCCTENGKSMMTVPANCKTGVFDENKALNAQGVCEGEICCVSNFYMSGNNFNYCFSSFSANCSGQKIPTKCSDVPDCNKINSKTMSCIGIANGDNPSGFVALSGTPFFCYNQRVYPYLGELSEPCGTKGDNDYGVCIKKGDACEDENSLGGRDCNGSADLKCCLDSGIW